MFGLTGVAPSLSQLSLDNALAWPPVQVGQQPQPAPPQCGPPPALQREPVTRPGILPPNPPSLNPVDLGTSVAPYSERAPIEIRSTQVGSSQRGYVNSRMLMLT